MMLITASAGAALCFVLHTPLTTPAHPALRVAMAMAEPAAMKLKQIKAELDALGVAWKGVYFERDDLTHALMTARARGPAPVRSAPGHLADAAPAAEPPAAAAAASGAAHIPAVDVPEETEEATQREATQREAHELVWEAEEASRLAELQARAALFSASGALLPGLVLLVEIPTLTLTLTLTLTPTPPLTPTPTATLALTLTLTPTPAQPKPKPEPIPNPNPNPTQPLTPNPTRTPTPSQVGEVDAAQCELEMADARTPLLLDVFATWRAA